MDRRGFVAALFSGTACGQESYTRSREAMVRKDIQGRGVTAPDVLRAMRTVPRHEFVPEAHRSSAYADRPIPIGFGQTISQPYIVARMTELLEVQREHTVLEIGTGSGYQAAVLSVLARQVYSIELTPELAVSAAAKLRQLEYRNVTVRQGDGYAGWPEKAPFDRIIVTAAPPELPQVLIDQLKRGGRLVAPVGTGYQELVVVDKLPDGTVRTTPDIPVLFVPMRRKPAA